MPINITGTTGDDMLFGALTDEIFQGLDGNDRLWGDAKVGLVNKICGSDSFEGGNGVDSIKGDAETLRGTSVGGNDFLYGGDGADRLYGDAYNTKDTAKGGNDWIEGGAGDDYIYGDFLKYYGNGLGGNDHLDGGPGNDSLSGGRGDDVIIGGTGRDYFKMINHGDGHDEFVDFNRAEKDRFVIEGYNLTFAQLDTDKNGVVAVGDDDVTIVNGNLRLDLTKYDTSVMHLTSSATLDGIVSLVEGDFYFRPFLDWQP